MKTIPELLAEATAEAYPGTSFAPEIRSTAASFLEKDIRARAIRALRKAVIAYRPPVVAKTPSGQGAGVRPPQAAPVVTPAPKV